MDDNVAYVRIDSAARLCMDCNGVYDSTRHAACPACASQQSISAQTLIKPVGEVDGKVFVADRRAA